MVVDAHVGVSGGPNTSGGTRIIRRRTARFSPREIGVHALDRRDGPIRLGGPGGSRNQHRKRSPFTPSILDNKAIGKTLAGLDMPPASRILAKVNPDASLLRVETPASRPLPGAGGCARCGRGEGGRPPHSGRRAPARPYGSPTPSLH